MLKSMYSGISGMKANQTKLDVVGNNVANSGTTAFKKSSVRFSDTLNQTIIYSSKPTDTLGGVNPGQVGVGVKVAAIAKNMLQGSLQQTGIASDIAIDGDGFFVVELDRSEKGAGEEKQVIVTEGYTRDGSFTLDANGYLVTSSGYFVLNTGSAYTSSDDESDGIGGVDEAPDVGDIPETPSDDEKTETDNRVKIPAAVDDKGNAVDPSVEGAKRVLSYNIAKDGKISYVLEDGEKIDGNQQLKIATFVNQNGLEATSSNIYKETKNSGIPTYNSDGGKHGLITQGALEMSNVDLSEEFTEMIVTTRAFQASSKVITTSDELLQEIINLKR